MKLNFGQAILALLLPAALSVDITSDHSPKYACVCFAILNPFPLMALEFEVLTAG